VTNKQYIISWVEEYLFHPNSKLQVFISFLLYPFSIIYAIIVLSKRLFAKKIKLPIPVISIGNLTIGGSGKTPFLIALAKDYEDIAIILRGYKRESKGLHVVTLDTDVKISGDEAMLYTISLPKATVIVSEDRVKAIEHAEKLGCKVAFLDDGFSKSQIEKFDILIKPTSQPRFDFTLPSGAYREPKFLYMYADMTVEEDVDFKRIVKVKNPTKRMLLVTAISKPKRLDKFLPEDVIEKVYFIDHYMYKKIELELLLKKHNASSILTTEKDMVKMKNFNLPLSILSLHVDINPDVKTKINTFLADFR